MLSKFATRWGSLACLAVVTSGALAEPTEMPPSTRGDANSTAVQPVTLLEPEAPYSLEERLANLEQRFAMLESHPVSPSDCGPIASSRLATHCVFNSSTFAGFELTILKPHVGHLVGSTPPLGSSSDLTSDFDYDVAPRVFIGHERSDGLGFLATYWQFDHSTDPSSPLGIVTGLELHTLDLEVTNHVEFWGSDMWLTGGVRYGKLEQAYRVAGLGGALAFESEGVGPTLGARLSRALGHTGWDLFASGRASFLLTDNSISITGTATIEAEESVMKVFDARMGVSRTRQLNNGLLLTSEFAFEVQNWDPSPIAGLIGNDIALFGPTFRVALAL